MSTAPVNFEKNPWLSRAKKFLIALAAAAVEIGNVWVGGPDWIHPVAAVAAAVLLYTVPNAPTYRDPRANYMKAQGKPVG